MKCFKLLPAIVCLRERKNLLNRGKASPLEKPENSHTLKDKIKFGVRYIEFL
jgi:hypothetical protein